MSFDADVAIVGAGPLGLELAAALQLSGLSYLLFDKGQLGQMIYNFPPQTLFFSSSERISIAGIPIQTLDQQKCSREQYLAYLRMVASTYGIKVHAFEEVSTIKKNEGFELFTPKGAYKVRYLVIATGGTSSPRRLDVPGEDLPHVATKMIDPHLYFQQKVAIIGGKNSAAETALRLYHAGAYPTIIIRKSALSSESIKYWILPELEGLITKRAIGLHTDNEVISIELGSIQIRNLSNLKVDTIAADKVIKAIGFNADLGLLEKLGVDLITSAKRPFHNDATMETNVENLFVLGTVIGGNQDKYRVFIENSHRHVGKILNGILSKMGQSPTAIEWVNKEDAVSLNLEQ